MVSISIKRTKLGYILWILLSLFFSLHVSTATCASPDNWLITPEEATSPSKVPNFVTPMSVGKSEGPLIVLKNPKLLQRLVSPINIFIEFRPGKSGERADMGTLLVTRLGFINLDITDRLVEYIKGTSLDIKEAKLPTGEHQLLVNIKDVAGNLNGRKIMINVNDN